MDEGKRAPTKLSFQLAVPVTKKRKVGKSTNSLFAEEKTQNETKGEVILSISDRGVKSATDKPKEKPLVIPLPTDINAGKIGIKRKQDHLMLARIARGEDVDMDDVKPDEEMTDHFDGEIIQSKEEDIDQNLPLLLRNRRLELEEIADEDERFRADVNARPDACTLDDYANTPIDKFGEALLRGMDWKPGMQIGMNGRGLTKPIEFVPRPKGLGLGAHASKQKQKHKRKGQSDKPVLVVAPDADGRQRHYRDLDEKLIDSNHAKKRFRVGALVAIVQGPHEGVSGQIEEVLLDDKFVVRFKSGQVDTLCMSDLSVLGNLSKNHPTAEAFASSRSSRSSRDYERGDHRDKHQSKSSRGSYKEEQTSSKRSEKERERERDCWLRPGISVRIVSKSFKSGRYYCKRAQVLDVISRKQCSVTVDGKVVEGIKERMIETALPKVGGLVMILRGRNSGRTGTLQVRNSKRNEAVVQHEDDLTIKTYHFEDVAQYNDPHTN